ncbi:MAG TPA: FAD-dependent oxidoreductase, partial [Longimicrobiales bacterium]|nr:FAD-dependent oxidoreductase [Longimicrobiales bacterium]
ERTHAWQSSLGHAVEWLDGPDARRAEPQLTPSTRAALRVTLDYQVDNRALTRALWLAATGSGATLVRSSPVVTIRTGSAPAGARASAAVSGVLLADGEVIPADSVVLAAGSWSGLIGGLPRSVPVSPVPGQVIELLTVPNVLRHMVMTDRCYLVPRADGRLLVGATAEPPRYFAEPTAGGMSKLLAAAIEAVPTLADAAFSDAWAGLRPGTPDHLPILGEDPDVAGLFYATGHYRNGILLAPITASLIGDVVTGRPPALSLEPFRPDRFAADA